MSDVHQVLAERATTYGEYPAVSRLAQELKSIFYTGYNSRTDYMNESLDMIANKLARILNGDPYYVDSWRDVAGYAQLVVNELEKIAK